MTNTIERAFELARGGSYRKVSEIARQLRREQHEMVEGHLGGRAIRKQLQAVLDGRCASSARPSSDPRELAAAVLVTVDENIGGS